MDLFIGHLTEFHGNLSSILDLILEREKQVKKTELHRYLSPILNHILERGVNYLVI